MFYADAEGVSESGAAPLRGSIQGRRMANHTILLIDYEPRSIERFRQPLTAAGYRVEIATDGIAGVEAFGRLNPDMVLVEP